MTVLDLRARVEELSLASTSRIVGRSVEPLAIISLDRRKLSDEDDTEQWIYDGPRVVRDIHPGWEITASDIMDILTSDRIEIPPGSRFIMFGRWEWSRDYWTGDCDAWIEDVSLVPIHGKDRP